MQTSSLTAREMYEQLRRSPKRKPFGFGAKAALVHVDLQNAYTRTDRYATAYSNDPRQLDLVNTMTQKQRALGWPVVWTTLAYMPDGSDCGVWGTRSNTPDSLQNIGFGSDRALLDERLHPSDLDMHLVKKMPSAFHGTHLLPYLVAQRVDTVVLTGGSTSGCVRATVVDSLSNGFRTIVAEECVGDVHESPHFASLYDMQAKYADVLPTAEILRWMDSQTQ
jgi:maleamate amidohydrolase